VFIVVFEDGTTYDSLQGTWADCPKDKKIVEVQLTDGQYLNKALVGCDKYLIVTEAIAGVEHSVDGEITGVSLVGTPTAHTLYGWTNLQRNRDFAYNEFLKLEQEVCASSMSDELKDQSRKVLNSKYQEFVNSLNSKELLKISLALQVTTLSETSSEVKVTSSTDSVSGLGLQLDQESDEAFKEHVRKYLLR
jgi:hypothetical protein